MIATGAGLMCPKCGSKETAVKDSRAGIEMIRRRRQCMACPEPVRFSTIEIMVNGPDMPRFPVDRGIRLQAQIDSLPSHKREIVLSLIAAFTADEVKHGTE